MLRAILAGVLAMSAAAACGKDSAAPVATTHAPAGKVLETVGTVTATRDGKPRALATGNEVFADDVVETAGDGSVVIELAHNHARWSLEGGLRTRVDESVAWKLDAQAAAKTVEHATSAAGRHAGRQAATTKESEAAGNQAATADKPEASRARDNDDAPEPVAGGSPPPGAGSAAPPPRRPVEVTKPPPEPKLERAPEKQPAPKDRVKDGGAVVCDEVACVLNNNAGPCCAKFKKGGKPAEKPPASSDVPETLPATAIRAAIMAVRSRVMVCNEKHPATGTVKVKVVVAPAGTIASITVVETPDAGLGECVVAAVKLAKFPQAAAQTTFTFPFAFSAPP